MGSSEITCNTFLYGNFTYSETPQCVDLELFGKSLIVTSGKQDKFVDFLDTDAFLIKMLLNAIKTKFSGNNLVLIAFVIEFDDITAF